MTVLVVDHYDSFTYNLVQHDDELTSRKDPTSVGTNALPSKGRNADGADSVLTRTLRHDLHRFHS